MTGESVPFSGSFFSVYFISDTFSCYVFKFTCHLFFFGACSAVNSIRCFSCLGIRCGSFLILSMFLCEELSLPSTFWEEERG